jgi:hypothetical protein
MNWVGCNVLLVRKSVEPVDSYTALFFGSIGLFIAHIPPTFCFYLSFLCMHMYLSDFINGKEIISCSLTLNVFI